MRRHGSAIFLLWALGCSARDPNRDAGQSTGSFARVELSYTRVEAAGAAEAHFDARAHFIRYRSFDPGSVTTLLGLADFDAIPLDTCRVVDGTAELDDALSSDTFSGGSPEVALLDAGRLELRGPTGPTDRAQLQPRHYPELVPFMSGVVYSGDEERLALALGQPYQVAGEGGEIGPFGASATLPRAFPTLSTSGLRRDADLQIRWADDAETGELQPLELELKWTARAAAWAVRCRVRDDGEFTISRDLLNALPLAQNVTATLSATRRARGLLLSSGIGPGELVLGLRDLIPLQVAP